MWLEAPGVKSFKKKNITLSPRQLQQQQQHRRSELCVRLKERLLQRCLQRGQNVRFGQWEINTERYLHTAVLARRRRCHAISIMVQDDIITMTTRVCVQRANKLPPDFIDLPGPKPQRWNIRIQLSATLARQHTPPQFSTSRAFCWE